MNSKNIFYTDYIQTKGRTKIHPNSLQNKNPRHLFATFKHPEISTVSMMQSKN